MRTLVSDRVEKYDGSQLRAGWLAEAFGLAPDAAAAFTGPCDVAAEHMVDLEDLEAGATIVAREMLHLVVEHIDGDLMRTTMRQRLLMACAMERLSELTPARLARTGDDIFVVEPGGARRKLTVSVATRSRAGTGLIHAGINIDPAGAPVPAVGLAELGIDPSGLARDILAGYAAEVEGVARAAAKVREAP